MVRCKDQVRHQVTCISELSACLQDIGGGAFTAPASTASGKAGTSSQPIPNGQSSQSHGKKGITDAALEEWRNCVTSMGPEASETPRSANRINSISQFFKT